MRDWQQQLIWWHCYPLNFVGAPRFADDESEVHHRLPQLINWLDYVIELGANGLLLAPIFTASSHGYDTLDHYNIDPRLGDLTDFRQLLDAAHERGIRLALDGVFNHLSRDHHIVKTAMECGPDTEEGDWIKWSNGFPYLFEGHENLVELNLKNHAVQDFIVDIMNHWLDNGIDAWRLDAAYAAGAHAWQPIIARVKERHPDAFIFGEVIHGDYVSFVTESGMDSVTQYELWKAIWSSLNDENFHELAWTLNRHAEFCHTFTPMTFIGNHDTTRIATKLTNPAHLPVAIALLLLLPGIPTIYAGDEQAFTGEKLDQEGGDEAVRPPFPETPDQLAPFGAETLRVYQEIIGIRRRNSWLSTATLEITEVTNKEIAIQLTAANHPGSAGHLSNEPGNAQLILRLNCDGAWQIESA